MKIRWGRSSASGATRFVWSVFSRSKGKRPPATTRTTASSYPPEPSALAYCRRHPGECTCSWLRPPTRAPSVVQQLKSKRSCANDTTSAPSASLISVSERTREIGIRMAIGARQGDVRVQFLVEAVTLCFLGGVVGTLLGLGVIYGLSRALGWSMLLSPLALAVALATSFACGIFFGSWPAHRAAQ